MSASKRSLMMFRPFFQKLRKGFSSSAYNTSPAALNCSELINEDMSVGKAITSDIKEGFFTVFAVKGKETQRFVIEIDHLANPEFLSLLDQAQEEYGFQQKGVLYLPCWPHELQEILENTKDCPENWDICDATMLESFL